MTHVLTLQNSTTNPPQVVASLGDLAIGLMKYGVLYRTPEGRLYRLFIKVPVGASFFSPEYLPECRPVG